MSFDREERAPATQPAKSSISSSTAPKPKKWGGEGGFGAQPTDSMLRAIFGSAAADSRAPKVYRDEAEYDWSFLISVAPDPYQLRDCTISGPTPADPDKASTSPQKQHPSHHNRTDDDPYGWYERDPEAEHQERFHADERTLYWKAIGAKSHEVQTTHERLGWSVMAFRHAENDEQLRSLLYTLPKAGWTGDVASLTDAQRVPTKAGVTVDGLFDEKNQLAVNEHDRRAIESTSKATQKGKGKTEAAAGVAIASDAGIYSALQKVMGEIEKVKAANLSLQAALQEVEMLKAKDEEEQARGEIEELKAEAEQVKEGVEILTGVATAVAHAVQGNLPDAIEQIGVVVGTVVGHMNDGKIAAAEQRLKQAGKAYRDANVKRVALTVEGARTKVKGALHEANEAKGELLKALTARRNAYNNLGIVAAKEIDGPQNSQHRISGMLAAIPLVEIVVARARAVHEASALPTYSKHAGLGLGMAQFHQPTTANNFVLNVAEISWARQTFRAEDEKWTKRLQQLQAVKQSIIGARPGDSK